MTISLLLTVVLSASIEGPTSFPVMTLGKFTGKIEEGAAVSWLVLSGAETADFHSHDECMIFTGAKGRYLVIMTTFGNDSSGKPFLQQVTKTVDIVDGPGPPIPPPPPPPPTPLPDGRFKMAAWAFHSCDGMPAVERAKASTLGSSFESLASQLDAGSFPTNDGMKAFLQATQAKVKEQGPTYELWLNSLKTQVATLGLKTGKDCSDCWREVAAGLKAVK